jgi:hypothetical protein
MKTEVDVNVGDVVFYRLEPRDLPVNPEKVGKASNETCDPMADTTCPLHSSKKSRLRHNETGRTAAVRVSGTPVLFTSGDDFGNRDIACYFYSASQ